jgi:CubicO group peptidase (beta-lactamase class C family)
MSIRFILIAALLVEAAPAVAQSGRMQAVEAGLTRSVVLKNRPVPHLRLEDRMKALNVRGVSIAVVDGYRIDWAKGYGIADLESGRPVTTATLFQAGSISKPVAAVAAMKLVEQGKLNLDEDVNARLKSWKVPENEFTREQKVTLRRILSHSAGLTVHGFPGYEAGTQVPSMIEILDRKPPANTAPIRVDVVPGTIWRYSGGGYTVMQLLLTEVIGRPFPVLMRDLVLNRAGMRESTYEQPLPAKLAQTAASGYRVNGEAVAGRYHTYPEMAAAGLWTTASDLARFVIEIQKSREGRSNRVLSKGTVEEMLREQKKPYGLGFGLEEVGGTIQFGHGGADEGFQAMITSTMDGKGLVVMTNSDNGGRLAREIAYAVAAAYGWPNKPREREAVTLTAEALAKFAGSYEAPQIGRVTIRVAGDHLTLESERFGENELYPSSDRAFFALGGLPDLQFEIDANGRAAGFSGGGVRAKTTGGETK